MVIDRRHLLAGLLSAMCLGGDARAQRLRQRLFVSCRLDAGDAASIACFDASGEEVFATSLPARGHDTSLRPHGRDIAVFARRPGDWFAVVDRFDGHLVTVVHAPEGRHLYGHGAFTDDGRLLYVTENESATGAGVIGIYDASDGYRRIGEFSSGGIGPHDILLLPDGRTLAVANGGLRTHPDTGREVLNAGDMKPNLALVDLATGRLVARHELGDSHRQLSIRHLAVRRDGTLAFGCQYQGDAEDSPPLLGLVAPGGDIELLGVDDDSLFRLKNYVGSVAFDDDGRYLVATSPHGGAFLVWDMQRGAVCRSAAMSDVCGVAPLDQGGFLLTSGNSGLRTLENGSELSGSHASNWVWDNHLRAVLPQT